MSRSIRSKLSLTISDEDISYQNTETGKLLFSRFRGKSCALLLQNGKLTAAAFPDKSKIGAIYIAKVRNVVNNIEACFVEIADGEICFLPFKEAVHPMLLNRKYDGRLLEGDELPVQLTRDAQKTKQASVTAHISLSNDFFALVLGSANIGFSAKLKKEQKALLTNILTENKIMIDGCLPQDYFTIKTAYAIPTVGMIVRTDAAKFLKEGIDISNSELVLSFKELIDVFQHLLRDAVHHTCFSCLKEAKSLLETTLDSFITPEEYSEIVTDDEVFYGKLKEYADRHFPDKEVRLYNDTMLSMNKLYQLDSKLETALGERVWLKSGGYLIIQPTEALTVIDVNSGKYEAKRKVGDDYAIKINREAAEEIAVQLRIRNLSGIIIADFINMETEESRQELINYLRLLVKKDKVKTTIVDMTPLGLIEITRKKITKPLYEQLQAEN